MRDLYDIKERYALTHYGMKHPPAVDSVTIPPGCGQEQIRLCIIGDHLATTVASDILKSVFRQEIRRGKRV